MKQGDFMTASAITICRVYTPPTHKDGVWILVDKLWPRGLKKDKLDFDLWLKEIAPSTQLRQSYHHDLDSWADFATQYVEELRNKPEVMNQVTELSKHQPVTLFYASKNKEHNHALVLQATLIAWPKEPNLTPLISNTRS